MDRERHASEMASAAQAKTLELAEAAQVLSEAERKAAQVGGECGWRAPP